MNLNNLLTLNDTKQNVKPNMTKSSTYTYILCDEE